MSGNWLIIAAIVSALAAVVNAVSVVVLVWITKRYSESTAAILEESRKARAAAESQASAARQSVAVLQRQFEEQLGLGLSVVKNTIDSAISSISYWKQRDLKTGARAPGFPPSDGLTPSNAISAVEHARRISAEVAQHLSSAFDALRNTRNEIERMRAVGSAKSTTFLETSPSRADEFLSDAFAKLQKARGLLG
jgi:hypothetical protein